MTSAQTMLARAPAGLIGRAVLALVLSGLLQGCEGFTNRKPELTPPTVTRAPYAGQPGEVLWGVVPLANESGTDVFDPLIVSDKLVAAVEEVEGIRAVPLNRTLQAMHALEMRGVRDPGDIARLADAMGVDGLVVGTITAFDPYDPPTIGLSIALYARTPAMGAQAAQAGIDPRALSASPTDHTPGPGFRPGDGPTALASAHLDARDHGVLVALRDYAQGRHDPEGALGWRRYTASMDLYTQFATQHLVAELVRQEHLRLATPGEDEPPAP
ncbi:MAG: hypothetical protein IPJ41_14320 [Phycisphaerales bacterium]|nr:hypothetical protein [Phycisphaerales bacterium]